MRYLAISLSLLLLAGCASQEVFDAPQSAKAEPAKPAQSSEKKAREPSEAEIMAAINTEEEMVEMVEASRQYQDILESLGTLRGLMARTLKMGQ